MQIKSLHITITFILFFKLSLVSIFSTAQNIEISGIITDQKSGKVLSFVNIQVENSRYGTITNTNGYYQLLIPGKYINNTISFSYIGYKTHKKQIKEKVNRYNIKLHPADVALDEIVIMPDSTLLTLLARAYKKIPDNYPSKPTKLKGFYRETFKTSEGQHIYFAEGVIEAFKTGYQKKTNKGQIKIVKSMMNEFPVSDSLFHNIKFYAGAFIPTVCDYVYQKKSFLHPGHFKDYDYSLAATTTYMGYQVYMIHFNTRNDTLGGDYEGTMYIEKENLAYIGFDIKSTKRGINKINRKNLGSIFNYIERDLKIYYTRINGKWHLKYVGKISRSVLRDKHQIIGNDEFIMTEIYRDNVEPIPLNQQLEYGDIFLHKAGEYYSEDYWDGYNILEQDTSLKSTIQPLYSSDQSKNILTMKINPPKEKLLIRIVKNLEVGNGLNYLPINFPSVNFAGHYSSFDDIIHFSKFISSFDYKLGYQTDFYYQLNNRWEIAYHSVASFSDKKFSTLIHDIGIACNFVINKKGKPFRFKLSTQYAFNRFSNNFRLKNNQAFTINSKTFNARELQIGIGKTIHSLKPKLRFYYQISGLLWLYLSGSYNIPFKTKDFLSFREKSGLFLTRKKERLPLNDKKITLKFNNTLTNKSLLNTGNFFLSTGIAIKY